MFDNVVNYTGSTSIGHPSEVFSASRFCSAGLLFVYVYLNKRIAFGRAVSGAFNDVEIRFPPYLLK
jgi:hypothetical protein